MFNRETIHKTLLTIAGSAIVAMSAAVIDSQRTNAVQDIQLRDLTAKESSQAAVLDRLNASLTQLDVDVAVLSDRVQGHKKAVARRSSPQYQGPPLARR